jgi:spore coat polysaccharide biosynthesis protein SpsF (cytidylyltransferase family)
MKIGLLVTARMGSTRLHDKHLKPLLGRPALSYLLERIENTFKTPLLEGLAQVFIATVIEISCDHAGNVRAT